MNDEKDTKPVHALVPAILLATVHTVLWILLLGVMLFLVPTFGKMLQEFDAQLPTMTGWAIEASRFSRAYWFLVLPVIALIFAADSIVLCFLYLHPKAVVPRWIWLVFMALVPLGLIASTIVAVLIPLVSLTQQLS